MAGVSECFSIGSTVSCVTCFKQVIEGDVLAFDPSTKMLILKCTNSGNNQSSDVFMVNLGLCSDVQVKNETNSVPETPPSLNLQRLNNRVRNSVEQKKRWVAAMSADVSPDGQKLFMAISKTIHEVSWSGSNIVVFNDVLIKPPYRVDNVVYGGNKDSKQVSYVKKMVERLTKDRPYPQQPQQQSHHMALQSQPLPQRQSSNANGQYRSSKHHDLKNTNWSSHSAGQSHSSKSTITNSNIKAN